MNVTHEDVKVGQDDDGVYFKIQFAPNFVDKVYLDEFFEEAIAEEIPLDVTVQEHNKVRKRPKAFYEECSEEERNRVRQELDLRPRYSPVRDDLNSYKYLESLYNSMERPLSFRASSIEEHKQWSVRLIEKLKKLIGYDFKDVPLEIEKGPETEFEDLLLTKYYFKTAPHLKTVGILARPKNISEPKPGIIAVHGHNKGKINTIGMEMSSSNSYYGIDLARRGYVTLSLDQWGWGETRGHNRKVEAAPEKAFALSALLLGKTAIAIRCWNVSRSIDFLKRFDFVSDKFGIIGQSGGGTTAAFSSVLDLRLKATVISGYFCTWFDSIFAMNHCPCNFVPNMMKYAELPDVIATRAPKPTFIVAGDSDPIFPRYGVKKAYRTLEKAFSLYEKTDNLGIDIIPDTGHVFRGKHAYPWLDHVLLGK